MNNRNIPHQFDKKKKNEEDQLTKILSNWKLILFCCILFVGASYIYVRYSIPQYRSQATLLIKDDEQQTEFAIFENLGIESPKSDITNEIAILTSRPLMRQVVDTLGLSFDYEGIGRLTGFSRQNLYGKNPLKLEFFADNEQTREFPLSIEATILPGDLLQIEYVKSNLKKQVAIGQWITTGTVKYRLVKTRDFVSYYLNKTIAITHIPLDQTIGMYLGKLNVTNEIKGSNLVTISMTDVSPDRAENIINTLIDKYNGDVVNDKNEVFENTALFINERMRLISFELESIESDAQQYKTNNKLVDITSEAAMYLQTESELDKQILETMTQEKLAGYMLDYMDRIENSSELVPSNLGLSDQSIQQSIDEYNKLVQERNKALKTSSAKNPFVINTESQILALRKNLKGSLENHKRGLEVKLTEYRRSENKINSQISSVPKYEREYRSIMRQQQIKEALYLFLLQKREETALKLAVTVDNAKVVNPAYSDHHIISPKKNMIYVGSFILGLFVSLCVIYLRELLDYKVHSKDDIVNMGLNYLGDIPQSDEGKTLVATKGSKSSISEAFRLLRTNLDFVLGSKSKKAGTKRIFISSTISKEGKSFISINLASTLSLSGKKVLLMGMDLRAPKFEQYLDIPHVFGISNYLANDELQIEDLIQRSRFSENVDILMSGDIPPNPSELLQGERVGEMFEILSKRYDYLIVDTAPLGLVTDTLLLAEYVDTLIYVVRANRLDKRMLNIPKTLYEERRFPNMTILLNGADHTGKGYGYGRYGYGYGYGVVKKKKWFEHFYFWKR